MVDGVIRSATGRRAVLSLAALMFGGFLIFQVGPYASVKEATDAPSLPEETLTTPTELRAFLSGLDHPARALYARFQIWDLVNAALIGTAGIFVLGWLLTHTTLTSTPWKWLIVLPIVLVAADFMENGILGAAIRRFPDASTVSAGLPWVTGVKLGAGLIALVAIILLSITALIRRFRTNSHIDSSRHTA